MSESNSAGPEPDQQPEKLGSVESAEDRFFRTMKAEADAALEQWNREELPRFNANLEQMRIENEKWEREGLPKFIAENEKWNREELPKFIAENEARLDELYNIGKGDENGVENLRD